MCYLQIKILKLAYYYETKLDFFFFRRRGGPVDLGLPFLFLMATVAS